MCNFGSSRVTIARSGIVLPILGEKIDPDEAEIAWRSWNLSMSLMLTSTFMNQEWPFRKPMKADKLKASGDSGLYAFKSKGNALNQSGIVWGQVALWGSIYVHAGHVPGYRAEFGYPVSLFTTNARVAEALVETYGKNGTYINLVENRNANNPGKITFLN